MTATPKREPTRHLRVRAVLARVVRHEMVAALRDRRLAVLAAAAAILAAAGAVTGHLEVLRLEERRTAAVHHARAGWDGLGPHNPHAAAHYGTWAFKPVGALAALDRGVEPYTGNVLRLEGHVQHEPAFAQAAVETSLLRLGVFQPALVLQLVTPLLLVLSAFASVSREREAGLMRQLVVQGARPAALLWGKVLACAGLGWAMLAAVGATHALLAIRHGGEAPSAARTLSFFLAYGVFYFLVAAASVAASAAARDARGALAPLLAAWLFGSIVFPRVAVQGADALHPLPARAVLEKAMADERRLGVDGHDPSDERRKRLEEEALARHGVARAEDLPFNFDGIVFQADEDYGNAVWDRHFGLRLGILKAQSRALQTAALADPFLALRSLSMGLAGTDLHHALDFQRQAESYRRELVRRLNHEHAWGGSKTGERGFEAPAEFFRGVPHFRYRAPGLAFSASHRHPEVLALVAWAVAAALAVGLVARRLEVE